jgi:hypothetical protein
MDQKSRDLLDAADKWFAATEDMAAAEEARSESEAQQEDLHEAEIDLAVAVMAWRLAGRPA